MRAIARTICLMTLALLFLIWFRCCQRRSRLRTSYFSRFLNQISRMRSFEFWIWFLCYQRRSRLRTSYFSRFLNPISRMRSFEFLIGFLCYQKRSRLRTSYFSRFLNQICRMMAFENLILLLTKKIVPTDLIFRKVSKLDFSHEVFEFSIEFICYQRKRLRLRTSCFSRFLNLISRMLSFESRPKIEIET